MQCCPAKRILLHQLVSFHLHRSHRQRHHLFKPKAPTKLKAQFRILAVLAPHPLLLVGCPRHPSALLPGSSAKHHRQEQVCRTKQALLLQCYLGPCFSLRLLLTGTALHPKKRSSIGLPQYSPVKTHQQAVPQLLRVRPQAMILNLLIAHRRPQLSCRPHCRQALLEVIGVPLLVRHVVSRP